MSLMNTVMDVIDAYQGKISHEAEQHTVIFIL